MMAPHRRTPRGAPEIDRLMARILPEPNSGCWLWDGSYNPGGYGTWYAGGRPMNAHRAAYTLLCGPVAPGLDLDHLCRSRACVNPAHLEPVTRGENLRRGDRGGRPIILAARTECPQGHPYSGNNLFVDKRGRRDCWECRRARTRAWRARQKECVA